ncbi:MAG: type II toxin-antitoxin system prevent-host-death family antitoxin [Phycisphaerales bacterium]|nr:type II toxin-antitoxin system prevent-host-death family antitoxin [Phycisphaerales bacterium]
MSARRVTATEFARNLSSMLNEVRYKETSLEVWRGNEPVARVIPAQPLPGFPIERLNAFVSSLPGLSARDAEAFLRDLDEIDRTVSETDDAWAS